VTGLIVLGLIILVPMNILKWGVIYVTIMEDEEWGLTMNREWGIGNEKQGDKV
jgi:hypothetical protein